LGRGAERLFVAGLLRFEIENAGAVVAFIGVGIVLEGVAVFHLHSFQSKIVATSRQILTSFGMFWAYLWRLVFKAAVALLGNS